MPLGNLKAIGRLHLSGRAPSGTPPNCRQGGDGGGKLGGVRARRKEKNRPQERRTSIVLMEPRARLSLHRAKREELSIFTPRKSLQQERPFERFNARSLAIYILISVCWKMYV